MPNTRKKVIKTVYKDDDSEEEETGDFSDSGSDANISEESHSSEEEEETLGVSSGDEFKNQQNRIRTKKSKKGPIARKTTFAKSFLSKIKKTSKDSGDEKETEELVKFSVKDLTEADKLLPSVLNLSESDSSDDDETPIVSKINLPSTSKASSQPASESDTEAKTEYQDVWSNNLRDSEEIAKKTFMELEKHKSKMEETKSYLQNYSITMNSSTEVDVKDLLAQGEEAVPEMKEKKPPKNRRKRNDSNSDIEDWEEVNDAKTIPQQGLQLFVDFPDAATRKSKKLDVEMMMRRKINRVKKEYQVYMHKVHVLCWLGHGNYVNSVLNDQEVMAAVITLVPSKDCYPGERIDMKYLEQITTWYKDKLTLKQDKNEDKFRPKAPPLKEIILSQIKRKVVTSKKYSVFIFVCLLRALGLQCRVMFNFVTLPIKPSSSELCSLSTKQKENNGKNLTKTSVKKEMKVDMKPNVSKTDKQKKSINKVKSSSKNNAKCKKASITQVDGNFDSDYDEDIFENIMQVDGNDDSPVKTRTTRSMKTKAKVIDIENNVSPPKRSKLSLSPERINEKSQTKGISKQTKRKIETFLETESIKSTKNDNIVKSSTVQNDREMANSLCTKLNSSPRKTRGSLNRIENKTNNKKSITQPKNLKSNPVNKPDIVITGCDDQNMSSKYFNKKESASLSTSAPKKLSLSRRRSQTATPATKETELEKPGGKISKVKCRTKSAPGNTVETSKYFASSSSKNKVLNDINKAAGDKVKEQKIAVLEDAQRVSHRELKTKSKSTKNDITGDLVEIIKGRIKQAKSESGKRIVKGKVKVESEGDSDYLPEEEPKKNPNSDSDGDFKPTKISPKQVAKRKIDRRVLSSDDEPQKNKTDVWCEVFVEELEQWISVDVIKAKIHCPAEIYKQATQPVAYVVGWNNNNYLKDVTRRYVPHWNTVTRKQRVDPTWWNTAVRPWLGPRDARDREEDEALDRQQMEAPLPKSIAEYKNHPLYALKRHLLKFEALYPPDAATLGFIRGEAVYARDCVYTCRSRDTWLKEAKVVKLGEKPYKVVKARPKWDKLSNKMISDLPLEVFGPWQVKDYEPPIAENGIVPRNAYGNVELFKECMLPRGTVHIKLPGLNKVAKKLNIDCAPAMTGFDFNGGYTHPVFDGFIVCKEFEDIITEAWVTEQEEQERKEQEKFEARVYGNWRRLIKGLMIRERLKHKYGFEEPATSKDTKKSSKAPKLVVKKRC